MKGSTTGTYSSSFTLCNGFLHIIELTSASSSVTVAAATYSGFSSANAIAIVDKIVDGIHSDIS